MDFFFGVFDNDEFRNLDYLKKEEERITKAFDDLKKDLAAKQETGRFDYAVKYNLELPHFKTYLTEYINTMTLFHFSGHHGEAHLQLTDQLINDAALIDLLNNSDRLKLVFLNGCDTEKVVERLTNIPIVIGTREPINDQVAMEIAASFYELLVEDIDNFLFAERIEKRFHQAVAMKELEVAGNNRGELSFTELENTPDSNKYIFEINNKDLTTFRERMLFGMDIDQYPANEKYRTIISEWFETTPIESRESDMLGEFFYRYFPEPLSYYLKWVCPEKGQYHSLGEERFEAIQKLYFTLCTFIKYCGISFLWEYLLTDKQERNERLTDALKKETRIKIKDEIEENWYLQMSKKSDKMSQNIDFLFKLYRIIIELKTDNSFAKECYHFLRTEKSILKNFATIFCTDGSKVSKTTLINGESFLNFFHVSCKFLRHYEFASVQKSYFLKYKIQPDRYRYFIRYFTKDKGRKLVDIESDTQIYDVYSMLLMDKRKGDQSPPIINLSPFYVDKNVGENESNQINLECLAQYSSGTKSMLYFSFEDNDMDDPKSWKRREDPMTETDLHEMYFKTKVFEHIDLLIKTI